MKHVWIIIPLVLLMIIGTQKALATCVEDEDWPDKPCYMVQGEFFTLKEKQAGWLEYYQYKGNDWLVKKDIEMQNAIESKTLKQWIHQNPKPINHQNENNENYNYWFLQYIYHQTPHYENGKYVSNNFESPIYQFKQGKPFGKIECNNDLILVKRSSDKSPMCIKESNVKKFSTKGLTVPSSVLIEFFTDKDTYQVGESIPITMKNTGETVLEGRSTPCGFDILNENKKRVKSLWGNALALCKLYPSEKITSTWDAVSSSVEYTSQGVRLYTSEPVKSGTYTLHAEYNDPSLEQRHDFEKQIKIIDPNNAFELLNSIPSSEYIKMLKDSELVFSGKLESKIQQGSTDSYDLEFNIIENFRNTKDHKMTVYTHEGAWKDCAGLEEDSEYLIFASRKSQGTMTCYNAIILPTNVTDEFREFSSNIPWWLNVSYTDQNIAEIKWLETNYSRSDTGIVRLVDPDMDLDQEKTDNVIVKVWSNADTKGIDLVVTETNVSTGVFEGEIIFSDKQSLDYELQVAKDDKIIVEYIDKTLPESVNTDEFSIIAESKIS